MAVFSVIISEKGGAERRETFDRAEINVGRVQGNDLMLPKGNVSKRHARLLFRDGRFIVTDLKSTNGTYVNGRKIAQATIVREGDKIYIGDFVIRIEPGAGPSASGIVAPEPPLANPLSSMPPAPEARPPQPDTSASIPSAAVLLGPAVPPPPPMVAQTPYVPPAAPLPQIPPMPVAVADGRSIPAEPPSSSSEPSSAEKALRPPSPRIEPKTGDRHEVISHFPLEHDPDESVHFAVPGPPRVPSSPRAVVGGSGGGGKTMPVPQAPPPAPIPVAPARTLPPQPSPSPLQPGPLLPPQPGPHPLDRPTSPSVGLASLLGDSVKPPPYPAPRKPFPSTLDVDPARARALASPGGEPARAAAHRGALAAMVERIAEVVDLGPLAGGAPADEALAARIERALAEAAAAVRGQGDLDVDALVVEARREILEHGPLAPLFDDEDVTEIQIVRHDYVVAMHGARQVPSDVGFTSEQAVGRILRRLCHAAGSPLGEGEVFVERRLARGARLFAVLPRAEDSGHMVVIRKPQRADLSLEDLVRAGTISRAMAGLFAQCVAARANILVTGADGAGATTLLGALAGAGSTEDRVMVLQEDDELIFNQPHTVSILLGDTPEERARAVQAAARVRPDRLVVGAFNGPVAAELVDAMGDGVDGVLAGARAPTLRQAVPRITADIAATKPGVLPEVAREWLASVFDLAIEIARLRDGRHRVLRVAELAVEGNRVALRDIFAFNVERTAAGGAIEGTFAPTGVVPGIIEDLAARGVSVDPTIFRRHGKNDSVVVPPGR